MNRREFLVNASGYLIFGALAPCMCGAAAPARKLLPFDAASMALIRKRHAGRPFVLAFWSLHCEPCRDEMAEWNTLKRKFPSLPIVLVSTDTAQEHALIERFFAAYPPGPVQKWVFADAFSERVRYSVDKAWRGELPKSYYFDSAHRVQVKSGRVDNVWLEAWAATQLAKVQK